MKYSSGCLDVHSLTFRDAARLSQILRPEDTRELQLNGWKPLDALWFAAAQTDERDPARSYGLWSSHRSGYSPIAAFGFDPNTATIWFLCARLNRAEQYTLLRHTKEWTENLVRMSGCERLTNNIAGFNEPGIKWLERSGAFDLHRDCRYVLAGHEFIPFTTKPLGTVH